MVSGLKASMDLSLLEGFGVKELSPQMTNNAEKFLVSGLKKTDCSTFIEYRWEQYQEITGLQPACVLFINNTRTHKVSLSAVYDVVASPNSSSHQTRSTPVWV